MQAAPFTLAELNRLAMIRKALGASRPDLTLGQLISLLVIALEPGLSVNDLAARVPVPQQSASRNVAVLLGRYASPIPGEPCEALISQEINPLDPRKRALFLTETGKALARSIASESDSDATKHEVSST